MELVDTRVSELRARLFSRAKVLSIEATNPQTHPAEASLAAAQAHALASLARKVALAELLADPGGGSLSLIAAMAVSRWLSELRREPKRGRALRLELEAGRVAHRVLRSIRRHRGLEPGHGRLVSAIVAFEFAHPAERAYLESIVESEAGEKVEEAVLAASSALREAALVLEWAATRAEPRIAKLEADAALAEGKVRSSLEAGRGRRS
ncbi:MAG: hypothetical protein HY791_09155 [Deltaproteobacteria bacterium]|nr:hypothetical protein [Deltaproteobacteria bacterium]